ncbi:MAG: hypothetical protein PWP52_1651, partial [Bacteroidales bacterium]|nr:hypothetical protein [Bacteroidales bacterium]
MKIKTNLKKIIKQEIKRDYNLNAKKAFKRILTKKNINKRDKIDILCLLSFYFYDGEKEFPKKDLKKIN